MYSRRYVIFLLLLLTGTVATVHGRSLWDGLFLDDHWHQLCLKDGAWSLSALLHATTIQPDRFMNTWWQERPIQWSYIRPFAMFIAKAVYHLSGGSVKALHALSILMHLINALLVHHLCLRMTRGRFWSIVGALLLIIYSHSVFAVAWLAAQNALLATTLALTALLCYARASGLDLYAAPRTGQDMSAAPPASVPNLHWGAFAACVILWCLALLTRESTIILPIIMASFDLAFGGRQHLLSRLKAYLIPLVIGAAFLAWRLAFFYHPMPDFYIRQPDGPGYVLWWLAKLLHYLTAVVWLSPMGVGPSARFNPWTEAPADGPLMVVILAIMSAGYYMACRQVRGYWIWPLWILLTLLPVVPILATPHNGYMPSVGFAIAMVIGPGLRHRTKPVSIGRWCSGVAIWFLIATTIYLPIYQPMWRTFLAAERLTVASIELLPPPKQAKELFFINLPFVNIYIRYHLQETRRAAGFSPRGPKTSGESTDQSQTPRPGAPGKPAALQSIEPDFRTHVLTYAPNLLRMEEPCQVEQLDAHSFKVSVQGRGYFSGALGRFLIESMRPAGRLKPGEVVSRPSDPFEVKVLKANDQGVQELQFRFHEPLASERYCFYVGTPGCAAMRIPFRGPGEVDPLPLPAAQTVDLAQVKDAAQRLAEGRAEAAGTLLAAAVSTDPALRQEAVKAIKEWCQPVAQALAAPVQQVFAKRRPGAADWDKVRGWWQRYVDDQAVRAVNTVQGQFGPLRWERDGLFRIRRIASGVIRTDLYFTGPPHPGPR